MVTNDNIDDDDDDSSMEALRTAFEKAVISGKLSKYIQIWQPWWIVSKTQSLKMDPIQKLLASKSQSSSGNTINNTGTKINVSIDLHMNENNGNPSAKKTRLSKKIGQVNDVESIKLYRTRQIETMFKSEIQKQNIARNENSDNKATKQTNIDNKGGKETSGNLIQDVTKAEKEKNGDQGPTKEKVESSENEREKSEIQRARNIALAELRGDIIKSPLPMGLSLLALTGHPEWEPECRHHPVHEVKKGEVNPPNEESARVSTYRRISSLSSFSVYQFTHTPRRDSSETSANSNTTDTTSGGCHSPTFLASRLPSLNTLLRNKEPSPTIIWTVLQIITAYAHTLRSLNGNWVHDTNCLEAAGRLLALCDTIEIGKVSKANQKLSEPKPSLKSPRPSPRSHSTCNSAFMAILDRARGCALSREFTSGTWRDLLQRDVLGGVMYSPWFVVSALSEVHDIFVACGQFLVDQGQSIQSEVERKRRKREINRLHLIARKILFLVVWSKERLDIKEMVVARNAIRSYLATVR
eukprot:g3872.t1